MLLAAFLVVVDGDDRLLSCLQLVISPVWFGGG